MKSNSMKKWLGGVSMLLLIGATVLPVRTAGAKSAMGAKVGKAAKAAAHMPNASVTVTGPVKGSLTGKTFVIAKKGGPVTVDATGAKVRENGRFASLAAVKGGTMVTAKGSMKGATLKATEVTVHSKGKGGPKPAAMMKVKAVGAKATGRKK